MTDDVGKQQETNSSASNARGPSLSLGIQHHSSAASSSAVLALFSDSPAGMLLLSALSPFWGVFFFCEQVWFWLFDTLLPSLRRLLFLLLAFFFALITSSGTLERLDAYLTLTHRQAAFKYLLASTSMRYEGMKSTFGWMISLETTTTKWDGNDGNETIMQGNGNKTQRQV